MISHNQRNPQTRLLNLLIRNINNLKIQSCRTEMSLPNTWNRTETCSHLSSKSPTCPLYYGTWPRNHRQVSQLPPLLLYASFLAWEVKEWHILIWVLIRHLNLWAYSMFTNYFWTPAVFLMLGVCGFTTSVWLTCLSFKKSDFQSPVYVFAFQKQHLF